jgi:hypothetical protein
MDAGLCRGVVDLTELTSSLAVHATDIHNSPELLVAHALKGQFAGVIT